jgi:plastocyanin
VKIQRGQDVRWTNLDTRPHSLLFYYYKNNEAFSVGEIPTLMPNEPQSMTFNFEHERIDYHCQSHPNERGSVIIFQVNEESMSNADRLRFLSRNFGIPNVPLR